MDTVEEGDQLPPVTTNEVRQVSRDMDSRKEEIEDLPYPTAHEHLIGGKTPLWVQIDRMQASKDDLLKARNIIQNYRFKSVDELIELRERQKLYATLFTVDINFDKVEAGFASDLIQKVLDGRLISYKQMMWLQHFVYRYRNQLKDQIIYEENGSEELMELLGDNPRIRLEEIISECKSVHDNLNTRYDEN